MAPASGRRRSHRSLDFTTRTSSREAYVSPDRGQQGNAAKIIVAIRLPSAAEGRVEIIACGIRHRSPSGSTGSPAAGRRARQHRLDSVRSGTSVTVWWPESAWSNLEDAGRHFLPILGRFTDLNPHLTLCATWRDERSEQRTWYAVEAGLDQVDAARTVRAGIGAISSGSPAPSVA